MLHMDLDYKNIFKQKTYYQSEELITVNKTSRFRNTFS